MAQQIQRNLQKKYSAVYISFSCVLYLMYIRLRCCDDKDVNILQNIVLKCTRARTQCGVFFWFIVSVRRGKSFFPLYACIHAQYMHKNRKQRAHYTLSKKRIIVMCERTTTKNNQQKKTFNLTDSKMCLQHISLCAAAS